MIRKLRGQVTDMGGVIVHTEWIVKGHPVVRRALHLDAPRKTRPADRVAVVPQPYAPRTREVDLVANLHADKYVDILGLEGIDEMGNPNGEIAAGVTYTTDDVAGQFIVLTDNGDGTGRVAAVGPIGSAQVTATVPDPDGGDPETFVETFNIIPGDTVGFAFRLGAEQEVTPDV